MEDEPRALFICAHDDDEVVAAGGTIKKLTSNGVRVSTMIFALGDEGYSRIEDKDTIVETRKKERKVVQEILGTENYITYDFHDFDNLDCETVYRSIIKAVRLVRPHIVFTHLPAEYIAHRTLAVVAPEAIWQAGWQCSLELGKSWQVSKLYQFSVLDLIPKPSHIVDISDTIEFKVKAMEAYKSQHTVVAGIINQIKARALTYGSLIGVQYGEAFMRSSYIPVLVKDPTQMIQGI